MKFLKSFVLVFLLLAAIGAVSSAWASLHDEETVDIQGQAATLMVDVQTGAEGDAALTLGDNLAPGDSGSAPITIVNEGSIPGEVCAEIEGDLPSYLSATLDPPCWIPVGASEQTTVNLNWEVLDEDLGTGGQTFELSVHVTIRQVE
jgi:hypothetical protein